MAARIATEARSRIETEVVAEVAAAFAFAEESPFPDAAELHADVLCGGPR
jgi:TPP-dependent pyruvate/acetoin dehydrogenase alpha subunit